MSKPNKYICFTLVILLFLTGCVQTNILEELAIISARGVDVLEDDKVEKTLNIIRFDPEVDSIYTTISGTAKTLKGAREDAAYRTGYKLREGQLNIEIFGKEAAEQGISPFIEQSTRDASESATIKLAVSKRSAKEIFYSNSENVKEIGKYLDNLIDKEVDQGKLPSSRLLEHSRQATTIGLDAVVPLIDLINDEPKIVGMAVFQDDRYVEDITTFEAILLNLFLDKFSNTPVEMSLPIKPFKKHLRKNQISNEEVNEDEDFAIHFLAIRGDSKTKVKDLEKLKFQTNVYMEIDLLELSKSIKIDNEQVANLIEKEVEKNFKSGFEELLKKVQEANADPFGFGKTYRVNTKSGKLTEEEWREKFPNITVDFNVEVKLMHTGTIQ